MSMLGIGDDATKTADADAAPDAAPAGGDIPVPAQKPTPPPLAAPVQPQVQVRQPASPPAPSGIPLASTQPQMMPLASGPKLMALNSQAHSFPIDTSAEGILALKTTSNSAPRPVPLNIPAGTLAPSQRIPLTGAEFAQRMSDGLDKYKAMMVERDVAGAGTGINQVQ